MAGGETVSKVYVAVFVGSQHHAATRPPQGDYDVVNVIEWPDADVTIPWPEDMTAKEAIREWAKELSFEQGT